MKVASVNLEGIRALIESVTGVPTIWDQEAEPFIDPYAGGRINLYISSWVSNGIDEVRREYNETTDSITKTITGQRQFTLSVKCEMLPALNPDRSSFEVLESLRLNLQDDDVLAKLREASAGIRDIGTVNVLSQVIDGRNTDVSHVDIRLNSASVATAKFGGGLIKSADINGAHFP